MATLQVLQNIAMRICLKIYVPWDVHVNVIHQRASVSKLDTRLMYLQSALCHRFIARNGLVMIVDRVTRASDGPLIHQINPRLVRHSKNPTYKAIDTWNNLPPSIRIIKERDPFKHQVKTHLKIRFPLQVLDEDGLLVDQLEATPNLGCYILRSWDCHMTRC